MSGDHTPAGHGRLHDMDALRTMALLLGIVLHGAIPFVVTDFWPVQDTYALETDPSMNPYNYLVAAIHGFRMPVFFILSGFFTAMMLQSRGLRYLARHRLRRIGLPLLVSIFTIIPITTWLFAGDGFDITHWPLAWTVYGFVHLWFLWYLLLIIGIFFVVTRLGMIFESRMWWLLVPITAIPQYLMQEGVFGADTPLGVIPQPHIFAYYVVFFVFGVFFYRRRAAVSRRWSLWIFPAMVLVLPAGLAITYDEGLYGFEGAKELGTVLNVAYTWMMCFGLMGLFKLIASKKSRHVRYLSDSSYWVYICHLPLMIILQILFADWTVNVHLKFVLACAVTVAVLLACYEWGVRYTPIGTALNGPRSRL